MTTCAVIPAAGLGSRLGADVPKILLPVDGPTTVWHLLHRRLAAYVDHVHVVVAPAGLAPFRAALAAEPEVADVTVGVQPAPIGMGDAVLGAEPVWSAYDDLLVVWGDQVHLSATTVEDTLATHARATGPRCTLPLAAQPDPYVEYVFDGARLTTVRQQREGDRCAPGGLADVGAFCLSTEGLQDAWRDHLALIPRGERTGELNFLPFLPFLSERGWAFAVVPVADPVESRGINTEDDLAFARARLRAADLRGG